MRAERMPPMSPVLAGLLLLATVGIGVALRLKDPLSGPLAAEDPFTHVVFTKEALERGAFGDSFYLGTKLYPPGIHAFSGILSSLSGLALYDIAVFAPVALGGLAIVGMFALANRVAGPVAGLTAALLTAVMPEHVFRTNLYAPTAFDLALVPAWLFLFHLAFTPRDEEPADLPLDRSSARAAAAVGFLVLGVPLAFLHPWAVPLFGLPLLAYATLRAFRAGGPARPRFRQLAPAVLMVALVVAFAFASRWTAGDTGFAGFFAALGPLAAVAGIELPRPLLFLVLSALLGALALAAAFVAAQAGAVNARLPRAIRSGLASLVAVSALAGLALLSRRLPEHVEYFSQFQPATVILALVGVGIALVAPSRLGDLGLSLAAFMFPLTAINVFDSEFWPQRTVVYLGIAAALLAGVAVAWAATHAVRLLADRRGARVAVPFALLTAVLLVGGAVAARPMPTYPWYRLYSAEHFEGFEIASRELSRDEGAQAVVYSWEPALVVRTLALPDQARYAPEFFKNGAEREKILQEDPGHRMFVIVDTAALSAERSGRIDLSFLDSGRFHLLHRSPDGGFRLYEVDR